ncbi:MAG: dienelactone hydrolase family protein [Planctomycetes bacterium]|nr:dienelactone hydrolase family protein [Planctomycetota bacterium]
MLRAAAAMLVFAALPAQAEPTPAFTAEQVTVDGQDYGYRLLAPEPRWRDTPQPLVVFLHGAGERGDDGTRHLRWLPLRLAEPVHREDHPCWVLALQCPADEQWSAVPWTGTVSPAMPPQPTRALRAVLLALDRVLAEPGVDRARVYLTGLSMGGFGAFELAMRAPERFAALLAVCGGGDPNEATRLLGLPTTVFHGAADPVVPVQRSRAMVAALRALGAPVHYHELDGVGHDAWTTAYGSGGALDWLFAQDQRQQRRGVAALPPLIPAADAVVLHDGEFRLGKGARCIADGLAHAPARVLLEAWPPALPVRPGLVRAAVPRSGDLVFEHVPTLAASFELAVTDVLRVRGRDAEGLLRGAAAAWQALHSVAEPRCRRGRWVRVRPIAGGTVELPPAARWPAAQLRTAIRLCWSHGADALAGPGLDVLDWLDDDGRHRVRADAELHGVRLVAGGAAVAAAAGAAAAAVVVDGVDLLDTLGRPVAAAATAPRRFRVVVADTDPVAAVARLRLQLPAAAERLDRGAEPVHAGAFLTRLGQLLRHD